MVISSHLVCGSLLDINIEQFKINKATVLRGLPRVSDQEYVEFACRFGKVLPYNDGPIYSFFGETWEEVEMHYDGISASSSDKVPEWIVFRVEQPAEKNAGGRFRIADAENALKYISSDLLKFLRNHRLQFFGYYEHQQKAGKNNEFSFEIPLIQKIRGREVLRLFMPCQKRSDTKKLFNDCSVEETNAVFEELRKVFVQPDVVSTLEFEENDILILNNFFTFHGREQFTKPVVRKLDRIQLLTQESR